MRVLACSEFFPPHTFTREFVGLTMMQEEKQWDGRKRGGPEG